MPKIDYYRDVSSVDIVSINLLSRNGIAQYEADARRRSDWTTILSLATYQSCAFTKSNGLMRKLSYLITKTTHSGSNRLLIDSQPAIT